MRVAFATVALFVGIIIGSDVIAQSSLDESSPQPTQIAAQIPITPDTSFPLR